MKHVTSLRGLLLLCLGTDITPGVFNGGSCGENPKVGKAEVVEVNPPTVALGGPLGLPNYEKTQITNTQAYTPFGREQCMTIFLKLFCLCN